MRRATAADAPAIGRLLHDFNTEYEEETPGPDWLAGRIAERIDDGETAVFVGGAGPDGLAVCRFRPSLWTPGLECYLAELYVAPPHRGHGLGQALLEAAIAHARDRGADWIELNTEEDDTAARGLYAKLGFTNGTASARSLYYELDLR